MSFQSLKRLLTDGLYGSRTVMKQLAAAPSSLRNDSDPYWSGDARDLAFDLAGATAAVVPAGHGKVTPVARGLVRGVRPAGTELLVQSGDATDVLTLDDRLVGRVNGVAAT